MEEVEAAEYYESLESRVTWDACAEGFFTSVGSVIYCT